MGKKYEYGWVMPPHRYNVWERFLLWLVKHTVRQPQSDFDITFSQDPHLAPGTKIRISRTPHKSDEYKAMVKREKELKQQLEELK